jgi:hypothetical protein
MDNDCRTCSVNDWLASLTPEQSDEIFPHRKLRREATLQAYAMSCDRDPAPTEMQLLAAINEAIFHSPLRRVIESGAAKLRGTPTGRMLTELIIAAGCMETPDVEVRRKKAGK